MKVFSIVENVGFLFVSDVISRLLSFSLFLVIAHTLGKTGLGDYSFIFAFIGLFVVFSDMGISTLFVREVAKDLAKTAFIFKNALSLKIVLSLVIAVATALAINFTGASTEVKLSVYVISLATFFYNVKSLFSHTFQAHERMLFLAFVRILELSLVVALGITALRLGYGLLGLSFAFLISYFVMFVITGISVLKLTPIRLGFDYDFQKKFLKASVPFWFTGIFIAIYFRIDTVMLEFIKGPAETGLYNASYRLLDALYFIPSAVIVAVFPVMSRLHLSGKSAIRNIYRKSFYYLLAVALPMGVGITLLAERLILFIYGPEFFGSHLALQILIWALVAVFLSSITGYLLNAVDKQLSFTLTTALAAFLNIVLNLFFIPLWGYVGAAASTVITEFFVLFGLLYFSRKNNYKFNILKMLVKPSIATFVMALVIFASLNLHILLIVPIAVITYFAALFLIRGVEKEELFLVKSYFKRFF